MPSAKRSRSACSKRRFASAEAALDADAARPLLFLAAEGWHKGLLGLIAGRVAERFRLPTFVVFARA